MKKDEAYSIISQVLKLNTAQDEPMPAQTADSFYTNSRTIYAFYGEKAFVVSFNRLIIYHASGTILILIYIFPYHVFFSLSFFPDN